MSAFFARYARHAELAAQAADLAGAGGLDRVGAKLTATASSLRLLRLKLAEWVSVTDFTNADGSTVQGDGVQLCHTGWQNAVNYCQATSDPATYGTTSPAAGACTLFVPAGFYKFGAAVVISRKLAIVGDGPAELATGSRILQAAANEDCFRIEPIAQGMSVSFEDLTMRGGGVGTTGSLIRLTRIGAAKCNSARIERCFFGTPESLAINAEACDDINIIGCVFDASAGGAVALGKATADDVVSNAIIDRCNWFAIPLNCVLLYNVKSLIVSNARVTQQSPAARTLRFINAQQTIPYQVADVSIIGGNFENLDCMLMGDRVERFTLNGATCRNAGGGAAATLSFIELYGACTKVAITGVNGEGNFGARSFYDDSAAGCTVTTALISDNNVEATGGTGQALNASKTSASVIRGNNFPGWAVPSVGARFVTTGAPFATGVIAAGGNAVVSMTVPGAMQGDEVRLSSVDLAWPVPVGLRLDAFIGAPNRADFRFQNVTAGPIGMLPFDAAVKVERG